MIDHRRSFADAITDAGLTPPAEIIDDGQLHRFAPNGKKTDLAGWYILHCDGIPAGAFGDWREGFTQNWRADIGRKLTADEEKAHRLRANLLRKARETAERQGHEEAAAKAEALWQAAKPVTAVSDHPYLERKRASVYQNVRLGHDGWLLVPMKDIDGKLWNLERIAPAKPATGTDKKGLFRGKRTGLFFTLGAIKYGDVILLAEGFATGNSLYQALGHPTVVAFNAGNLAPVAKVLKQRYPDHLIVICGDDDYRTRGNPGRSKASEAARQSGGVVAVPDFGNDRPEGATDFNDLHLATDLATVQAQVETVIRVARGESGDEHDTGPEAPQAAGDEWRGDDDDHIDDEAMTAALATVTAAIAAQKGDPGACLTHEVVQAWCEVYARDQASYERLRAKAKAAGARVAEIDRAIGARSKYAKERAGKKSSENIFSSYTSNTSNTDKASEADQTYTDPFQSYTSNTEPLPPECGALVRHTERGPRLKVVSEAALIVAKALKGRFAYCPDAAVWHVYRGAHWEAMATNPAPLQEALTRWMYPATEEVGFTPSYADGILTVVQRSGLRTLPKAAGAIPFNNGLLDITTGNLTPVTPDNAHTWSLACAYQPEADCPGVKAWLLEAVGGDQDVVELLRAFLAALLRGGAHLQRFLHLIGPGGTGKSTFLRLLEAMIGTRNTISTDLKELEQNRFEAASLYGKRAALITDSDRYGGAVNKLKAITGQDPIRLERKHVQQAGTFVFDGLVIMASNEPLATTDYTSGIERRRVTVAFDRRVTEAEKLAWIAQGGEQAVLHRELPGVVNWALALPVSEMERIIRHPPAHTIVANLSAMAAGNPVADWLTEACIPEAGAWTQIGKSEERRDPSDGNVYFIGADHQLYPAYLTWCRANGRTPLSLRRFRNVMVDAVRTLGRNVVEARRATGQGLVGIRLRQPTELPYPWHLDHTSVGSVGSAGWDAGQNAPPEGANVGSVRNAASEGQIHFGEKHAHATDDAEAF